MTEPLRLDAFHLDGLLGLVRAGQLTAEQRSRTSWRGHASPRCPRSPHGQLANGDE